MVDTLTIVFLAPILTGAGTSVLPALPGDSIVITWTVEISEGLILEKTVPRQSIGEVVRYPGRVLKTPYVTSAAANPGDAATVATKWGLGGLSGRAIGYASVGEHTLTKGWAFRVGAIREYLSDREREIRWLLVYGVF